MPTNQEPSTQEMRADKGRSSNRTFLSYIDKSRNFYAARGFKKPYEWATFEAVPFTPVEKSIDELRLAIVTTAFPHLDEIEAATKQKDLYYQSTSPAPSRMFTDDLSWDKEATHTNDTETFLPIKTLQQMAGESKLGELNHRFYGVPTEYSQRQSTQHGSEIADWAAADSVDAVLLVPL